MVSRHVYMTMMLSAASGLPYLMSSDFRSGSAEHATSEAESSHGDPASTDYASTGHSSGGYSAAVPSGVREAAAPRPFVQSVPAVSYGAPLATAPYGSVPYASVPLAATPYASGLAPSPWTQSADPGQYINFAVTPAWVLAQWPRVSASLAELDLQGYRVPLVTGTQESDLAGSLTYYFDRDQRVARITFTGSTGDPRRLITLVTGQFGFVQDASDEPAVVVYAVKWNKKSRSELRIRPARIVRAEDPRNRYDLELSIRRF